MGGSKGRFSTTLVRRALVIFILAAALASVPLVVSLQFRNAMVDVRKQELKSLVTLAGAVLQPVVSNFRQGQLSREEALLEICDLVRLFAYENPETQGRFFLTTYDGTLLVQPLEPEKEGMNQWDLRTPEGTYITRNLAEAAKTGGGFVSYYHTNPATSKQELKVSYVLGYNDLELFLGTGLYMTDIATTSLRYTLAAAAVSGAVVTLLLAVMIMVMYRSLMTYIRLHEAFGLVAAQPGSAAPARVEALDRGSESRRVVEAFNHMIARMSEHERQRTEVETLLRRDNEEKGLLLKEIHHRIKNNLQIVSSLLSLQMNTQEGETHRAIFQDSINRVVSMAVVHELLYESTDLTSIELASYVERLVSLTASAFGGSTSLIKLSIHPVKLSLLQAIPCGLFLGEALTNVFKYAAGMDEGVEITVGSDDDTAWLEVRDAGPGFPPSILEGERSSLGLTLMEMLARQLNGTVRFTNQGGAAVCLRFPLAPEERSPRKKRPDEESLISLG